MFNTRYTTKVLPDLNESGDPSFFNGVMILNLETTSLSV